MNLKKLLLFLLLLCSKSIQISASEHPKNLKLEYTEKDGEKYQQQRTENQTTFNNATTAELEKIYNTLVMHKITLHNTYTLNLAVQEKQLAIATFTSENIILLNSQEHQVVDTINDIYAELNRRKQ